MIVISNVLLLLLLNCAVSFRIGFTSCSSQRDGKGAIWDEVLQASPDYLILLGDNIYTDKKTPYGFVEASPDIIENEYRQFAEDPLWQAVVERIGWNNIAATWDDHDYGINDGDETYKYRNESMKSFLDFFRFSEDTTNAMMNRGAVYHSYTLPIPTSTTRTLHVKVILLDTRYFKNPEGTPHGDFLGEDQWVWLEAELQDPSADVILLGSSIQILPTQKIVEESWSTFPESRARLLRLVTGAVCPNVLLLSGDVHMAEVSQAVCFDSQEGQHQHQDHETTFRHLWEFSSSGMSHTFTTFLNTYTASSASVLTEGREGGGGALPKDVRTRGWLMNSLFNLYQVCVCVCVCGYKVCGLCVMCMCVCRLHIPPGTESTASRTNIRDCTSARLTSPPRRPSQPWEMCGGR